MLGGMNEESDEKDIVEQLEDMLNNTDKKATNGQSKAEEEGQDFMSIPNTSDDQIAMKTEANYN